MRFAAAALMAGLVFLAGVLSGFGSSSLGPRDFPQAIRLSGTTDQVASPEVSASIPDPQVTAAAAGRHPEPSRHRDIRRLVRAGIVDEPGPGARVDGRGPRRVHLVLARPAES